MILNTDDIRTCSSFEPALIGHLVACNKRLALLKEAWFAVLLVRKLYSVSLGDALPIIFVRIDRLGSLRFIRHKTTWCSSLEGSIDASLITRAYWTVSGLLLELVLVFYNLHRVTMLFLCLLMYRNRLHVEGTGRVWYLRNWSLSEDAFCDTSAPSWRSAKHFEFCMFFRSLFKDLDWSIRSLFELFTRLNCIEDSRRDLLTQLRDWFTVASISQPITSHFQRLCLCDRFYHIYLWATTQANGAECNFGFRDVLLSF